MNLFCASPRARKSAAGRPRRGAPRRLRLRGAAALLATLCAVVALLAFRAAATSRRSVCADYPIRQAASETHGVGLRHDGEAWPSADPGSLRLRVQPGESFDYRFEADQSMLLALNIDPLVAAAGSGAPASPAPASPKRMRITVGGRMALTVRDVLPDGDFVMGYRFSELSMDVHDPEGDVEAAARTGERPDLASIAYVCEGEVRAEISAHGRILRFFFPAEMPAGARNILKGLVTQTQFVFPEEDVTRWTTEEEDTIGRYEAAYAMTAGAEAWHGTKEKLRYLALYVADSFGEGDLAASLSATSVGGKTEGRFDPACGLATDLRIAEEIVIRDSRGMLEIRARNTTWFTLEAVSFEPDWAASGARRRDPPADGFLCSNPGGPEDEGGAQPGAARRGLPERTDLSELLGEAEEAVRPGSNPDDLWRIFNDLADLFAADPSQIGTAVDWIRQTADAGGGGLVVDALAEAGTQEAQRALIELGDDAHLSAQLRRSALAGLGAALWPLAESEAVLRRVAESDDPEVADTAVLALGGLTSHLQGTRADQGVAYLMDRLDRSQEPSGQSTLLAAIGNAGGGVPLERLRPYYTSDAEIIRASAAWALRSSPEGREALVRLASDPSDVVRGRAVATLVERARPQDADVLERIVAADASENIRARALSYFLPRAKNDADARRVVERAAREDASEDVRAFAAQGLR